MTIRKGGGAMAESSMRTLSLSSVGSVSYICIEREGITVGDAFVGFRRLANRGEEDDSQGRACVRASLSLYVYAI